MRSLTVALGLTAVLLGLVSIEHAAAGSANAEEKKVASVAPMTLDLVALEKRLRATRAIGMFTKLSLKNQVDDLLEQFDEFHDGHDVPVARLRERFDLLILKVLSLLQRGDPALARDVAASREPLWNRLVDPRTFPTLRAQGRAGA